MAKRILLLSDVNSSHTRKLVHGLAHEGFEVGVFSLSKRQHDWFAGLPAVTVFDADGFDADVFHASSAKKLSYFKKVRPLKKVIRAFRPAVVHAHYATSYGLLGWRAGFHPYFISAWGSDVMDFPKAGGLKRWLLRKILSSADRLMVTSRILEKLVKEITGRSALVTPFGVDANAFAPQPVNRIFGEDVLVFGTIKSLEKVYGTDVLLEAFAGLQQQFPEKKLGLLIVGDGTQRQAFGQLAEKLGIRDQVKFTGRVDHAQTPQYHNQMDVFMNLSLYESFGVSVLEAMACEKPVIVTDTGGLAEIVEEGIDGFRVPVKDVPATVEAMEKLLSPALRRQMGARGREKVLREFRWERTMELMTQAYREAGAR